MFDPSKWNPEFHAWAYRLGGVPVALLASHDRSESYEMDRAHVFKIRPGRYALVLERGCSCYMYDDAEIFIYGDERAAMKDYNTWLGTPTYNFNPTGTEAKE